MPLPSQTARIASTRSPMFRRKSRSPRPLVIAGVVTLGLIGVWWLVGGGGAGDTPPLSDQPLTRTTVQAEPQGTEPTQPEAAPAEPNYPPPTFISLGSLSVSPAGDTEPPPRLDPPPAHAPEEDRVAPAGMDSGATQAPSSEGVRATEAVSAPLPAAGSSETSLPSDLLSLITLGRQKLASEPVVARQLLTRALIDARAPEAERARLRDELGTLNEELVFSPRASKDDPFVTVYAIQSGDALEKIARKNNLATHWRLIQRVNRLSNPNRIQLNQKLKLVKGPFHAVVIKSVYRMDVYMGDPARPQDWVYVRSFRVGLGEGNSTPTGDFVVKRGSKLENPYWTNPRTGEQFSKDDPKNPIGERWLGLEGLGDAAGNAGYGIHGTIDPDSIGQQRSMGCVRLGTSDVELVYDLLGEGVSLVRIVP